MREFPSAYHLVMPPVCTFLGEITALLKTFAEGLTGLSESVHL